MAHRSFGRSLAAVALVVGFALSGCSGGSDSQSSPATGTSSGGPTGSASTVDSAAANQPSVPGCEVKPNITRGPVGDSNGPYGHQVFGASISGIAVGPANLLIDHASVPDGVRLRDGRILGYYVNGAEGGGIWASEIAADGRSAKSLGPVSINGLAQPAGAVDPDVTLLADGSIRLLFMNGFGPPSSNEQQPRTYSMCIADSKDGVAFTVVANAVSFTGTETTDPSLVRLADGSWLLSASQGQSTVLATSSDGLHFAVQSTLEIGGVAELARAGDAIRLFTCSRGNIEVYRSIDRGVSWKLEGTAVAGSTKGIVCDPSVVADASFFLFKRAPSRG